jgi:hypothetical protein
MLKPWFTVSRSFQYIFQSVSNQSIEAIVADREASRGGCPFLTAVSVQWLQLWL